jgi:DNA-binding Lrp family transcriptional regulator
LGYIRRFTIELGGAGEKRPIKYVLIELSAANEDAVRGITRIFESHPSVTTVYEVEGKWDFLVRIDEISFDSTGSLIRDLRATNYVVDTFTVSVLDILHMTEGRDEPPPDWFVGGV